MFRGDGMTERRAARRARECADGLGVDATDFARAATAARYGPPEGARAAAVQARKELRDLKPRLRRSLGFFDRARGLVSVRSLGLG